MKNEFLKAGFKLAFFILGMAVLVLLVKRNVDVKPVHAFNKTGSDKRTVFAIGSSRTWRAVDNNRYNAFAKHSHCINLGGNLKTFLFNYLLARQIIKSSSGNTLLIELSILNGRVPADAKRIIPAGDFYEEIRSIAPAFNAGQKKYILYPLAENYLSDYLCIGWETKLMLGIETQREASFMADTTVYTGEIPWPLANAAADNLINDDTSPERLYILIIRKLISDAYTSGNRVLFYLPPAFGVPEERQRLVSIFQQIPDNNKMVYTPDLLSKISNCEYYGDDTHFNVQGARVFTEYLLTQLDKPQR